jgi:DNA-binding Lrp family transcriptional regulator
MAGMEPLDDLDRRIVVALQNDGRASWTEIAQATGCSVATVTRRGQHLIAQGLVRIAAVPSLGQWGPTDQLLIRVRCEAGLQARVARTIAARPYVRFICLVTGAYDIVVEVIVPKGSDLVTILADELSSIRGVVSSDADLVLHTYKVGHDWSRQILGEGARTSKASGQHECAPGDFDDTDDKILDVLREDGRTSFPAVAQVLGVNESTVRRRYETLTSRGCLQMVTLVPAGLLGYETEVLLWLEVAPSRMDAVARELIEHRGVRFIAATLGQSSLMCEVIMPTTNDLFTFTTSTLAQVEGIQSWRASIEMLTLKRGFVMCPWAQRSA